MTDNLAYGGRSINCAECGIIVMPAAPRRKYCEECSLLVIRKRSYKGGHKVRRCRSCDDEFMPSSSAQKFCCLDCRASDERGRRRAATVARGGNAVGQLFKCELCGEKTVRRSAFAKFCDACRPVARKEGQLDWRVRNPDKILDGKARRRKIPRNRLDSRMGCAIWQCLRGAKSGWRWESLVGYTLDELMAHLESQFVDGMSWTNMEKWHVDHRVPKSLFQYETPDCPDFKRAWALTNLQPLWKLDNLKKGAKRLYLV